MMVADKVMKYQKQQCDGSGSSNEDIRDSNVMVHVADKVIKYQKQQCDGQAMRI